MPLTRLKIAVLAPMPRAMRQDRHRREAGVAAGDPQGVAHVLEQALGQAPALDFARRFADQRGVAEVLPRREPRLIRSEPRGGTLGRLFGEVKPDFFVELGLRAAPVHERAEARAPLPKRHGAVLVILASIV